MLLVLKKGLEKQRYVEIWYDDSAESRARVPRLLRKLLRSGEWARSVQLTPWTCSCCLSSVRTSVCTMTKKRRFKAIVDLVNLDMKKSEKSLKNHHEWSIRKALDPVLTRNGVATGLKEWLMGRYKTLVRHSSR